MSLRTNPAPAIIPVAIVAIGIGLCAAWLRILDAQLARMERGRA